MEILPIVWDILEIIFIVLSYLPHNSNNKLLFFSWLWHEVTSKYHLEFYRDFKVYISEILSSSWILMTILIL